MADPGTEPIAAEPSLEQRRALALASARRRAAEAEESGLGEQAARGAGLTARALGPTAVGAAVGGAGGLALGGPALAVPGAAAGALSMNIVKAIDALTGSHYLDKLMDSIGLPRPSTPEEKISSVAGEAMAGAGGLTAAAKTLTSAAGPVVKGISESVAAAPGVGVTAAGAGGVGEEAVRQGGGGPAEQLLGNVAGSMAVPFGAGAVQATGRAAMRTLGDVFHAIGASFGHKPSVERLASDVARNLTKESPDTIRRALANADTHVPGAKPTVAEAVAQENLTRPTDQVGGALVKAQESIAKQAGAEDIIPSAAKSQEAAIKAHLERLDQKTGQLRNMAFESARRAGRTSGLGVDLDLQLLSSQPMYANNPVARSAMRDIYGQLKRVMDPRTRAADPEALYDIRQRVGQTIRAQMEAKRMPMDNRLAAGLEREVQKSIDKAIVDGGAVGWRSYLDTYSKGMRAVEMHRDRAAAAKAIGQSVGARAPGAMVQEELPHLPTLLHRPTMFVNFVLKRIAQDATTPVMREIATRMTDPQEFAKLLARPAGTPVQKEVLNILTHTAVLMNLIQRHQQDEGQLENAP